MKENWLAGAIRAAGLTQRGLAECLGITEVNVSRWCHRDRPIPVLRRRQIAEIIGVSPAAIDVFSGAIPSNLQALARRWPDRVARVLETVRMSLLAESMRPAGMEQE